MLLFEYECPTCHLKREELAKEDQIFYCGICSETIENDNGPNIFRIKMEKVLSPSNVNGGVTPKFHGKYTRKRG